MTLFGPWVERLEAIAAGTGVFAVGGFRDAAGVTTSRVHVGTVASLEGKGSGWSIDHTAAVRALAFAGDDLLLTGSDDGKLTAWDVTGQKQLGGLQFPAAVRAIAVDANVARGANGAIAVGTGDGHLLVISLTIANGAVQLGQPVARKVGEGAVYATAFDPAGLVLAGTAEGQLWIVSAADASATARAVTPGGDGGIRAIVSIGDGRAAVGCGDGGIRLCYVVGDVEASDRSGDNGHDAAIRALVLGPQLVDAAGREAPRRMFSASEDGTIKSWLVDGRTRPRTIEPKLGAITGMVFQPVAVQIAGQNPGVGRLWMSSTAREVGALVLSAEVEPGTQVELQSELERISELLRTNAAAKVKVEAIGRIAVLAEDEARVLLDLATRDGATEVQLAAIQAISNTHRRASRPALRSALNASQPLVRTAAFAALIELEREQPLVAIRVGLAASQEDVRISAVSALIPLAGQSVIAAGLIADALRDASINVRRAAFKALRQVHSGDVIAAVRIALSRGTPDVRAEALLVLGFVARATDGDARALALGALDDSDAGVRTSAFLAALMQQPRLAATLYATVPNLKQSFDQVATQLETQVGLGPSVGDPRQLNDGELEPLFASLACRAPDAAIRGAGCLLALRDPRAVGAVLQLTREADPALRRGATSNLVLAITLWPEDDRLTARLVWLLDDTDAEVRAFAFDALARAAAASGPAAELELAETALRCSQEDLRVRALQILVRVGAPGSSENARADRLLGDALDDEAAKVRNEAFRTLWAWHASDPQTPIVRGAASRHGDLRGQVVNEIQRRREAKQSTAQLDQILLDLVKDPVQTVGLGAYGALTSQLDPNHEVAIPAEVHLAAMASPVVAVRAAGAAGARKAPAGAVRAKLVELIKDDNPTVHIAAIESLDAVAPNDAEGFALAFGSIFWGLEARACELCGRRRDSRAIAPATRILSIPKTDLNRPPDAIRQRVAAALADVGDPTAIPFLQTLTADEDGIVREQGARGVATAARIGSEPVLMALLGHQDLAVRSWAGEGLAKLGDVRALPVLAGTQRHDHRPLRIGAITGFVALGPDGVRGLRQGLEDKDREIQDLAFAVIVARDAALAEAGIAPDLLVDAMASPSPEIRFAAARLFERRANGEATAGEISAEIVGPRKPEKAADMKEWPAPARRAAIQQVIADAIASSDPMQRYAAAQVIAVRDQPLTYWREAERLAGPSSGARPRTNWSDEGRAVRRTGWLRRLVNGRDPDASALEAQAQMFLRAGGPRNDPAEHAAAQRLVFGVYAGLVRQAPPRGTAATADDTHRVRRDAVARLVELAREDAVGAEAVLPVLDHAIGDPHHLVRQAAMAALRSLYPAGALAPLQMAIGAAADLGKAAIDELVPLAVEGDERAAAIIRGALDADDPEVRAHAALRLPRLYPAGSPEPQLIAARSKHGDIRLTAITQLASQAKPAQADGAIVDALVAALASEHADLRLKAAVALAKQNNPLGVDVLGSFLRSEGEASDALEALLGLAADPTSAGNAAEVIGARLDEVDGTAETTLSPYQLINALATLKHPIGAPSLVRILTAVWPGKQGDVDAYAESALTALRAVFADPAAKRTYLPTGEERIRYREALALPHLAAIAQSQRMETRKAAAEMLAWIEDRGAEPILEKLLSDREPVVGARAAESLAFRVEYFAGATLIPLEAALRGGRRELVLPAALGLAARKRPEAFQPLLLVIKAGEPEERQRAVLALGSLGDKRALPELKALTAPEPDADDQTRALVAPAIEALGRLLPALTGDDATEIEAQLERIARTGSGEARTRAITGLRWAGRIRTIELIAADRETSSNIRGHAVSELGKALSPTSEALLAELLNDDDYSVRAAALAALTKLLAGDRTKVSMYALGSNAYEISSPAASYLASKGDAATVVARLGDVKNAELRRMLRDGLIRRRELPAPQLEAALKSSDPNVRAEAAWIVGAGGDAAKPMRSAIAAAVTAGEAGWRAAASKRGAAASTQLAEETEAWRAAMWAANRLGVNVDAAAAAALDSGRVDPAVDPAIRREAAIALRGDGARMEAFAGDRDREVRAIASAAVPASRAQAVVQQLGARADATTIEPLAVAAFSRALLADPGTRAWSSAVAVKQGQTVEQLIAIATATGEDPARLVAIAALGQVGGEAAKAALEKIHGDEGEPDAVKLAAWKALRRLIRIEERKTRHKGDKGGPGGGGPYGGGDDSDGDGDGDGDDHDDDHDHDSDGDDDPDGDDGDDDDSDDDLDGDGDGDDDDSDDGDDDDSDDDDDDTRSSASHADGVIQATHIQRDNDFMYYVKPDGIYRVRRKQPGDRASASPERVAGISVELDVNQFIYYLDQEGNLAAKRRHA